MDLPYKISNTVRAESELESAINYYQEVANDRVAENFINEFVKILDFIKHFPFQRIYKRCFYEEIPLHCILCSR